MTLYRCSICSAEKVRDDFFSRYGKRRAECKECSRLKLKAQRASDEYRASRRQYQSANRDNPTARARERRHVDRYRKSYPHKGRAQWALNRALAAGTITRPTTRQRCNAVDPRGKDGRTLIHGHHHDYTKPLDVEWLCTLCHSAEHRALAA